jgi:hypothetical protein
MIRNRLALAPCFAALLIVVQSPPVPADTQDLAFVQVSRARLRESPSNDSRTLDYLHTNDAVAIQRRVGDWCEVRTESSERRAFVACGLLGPAALTPASIRSQLARVFLTRDERAEWLARAYWTAPSLLSLLKTGEALEEARLSRPGWTDDGVPPPDAGFNAMKAHIQQAPLLVGAMPDPVQEDDFELTELQQLFSLPAIRASHFGSHQTPLGVPLHPFPFTFMSSRAGALADALSAHHQVPMRVRLAGRPRIAHYGSVGAWDIRSLEVTFNEPVTIHAIDSSGAMTGYDLVSFTAYAQDFCGEASLGPRGRPVDARWRSAIVGWVGKPPIGSRAALPVSNCLTPRTTGSRRSSRSISMPTRYPTCSCWRASSTGTRTSRPSGS